MPALHYRDDWNCEIDGERVPLPRSGADDFWKLIHQHYAAEDSRKWKYLAMLALRENAGWRLEDIGRVFDHPKGHVSRCLEAVKNEIRQQFRLAPELLDLDPVLESEALG